MKNIIVGLILLAGIVSCVPTATPTSSVPKAVEYSPETEARELTTKMKTKLNLDTPQEDKI